VIYRDKVDCQQVVIHFGNWIIPKSKIVLVL